MLSALWDAIGRLEHSYNWEARIPSMTKVKEYYLYEIDMDELKDLVNNCDSLEIITIKEHCSDCGSHTESHLKGKYDYTEEEKQKELDHCLNYRRSAINFIKKCLENHPDQKEDCDRVLLNKGLKLI